MKLVRWKRFTWDLNKLPPHENKLPLHYLFRPAAREEAKAVQNVIVTAFSLDSAWSAVLKDFRERLEPQLDLAFTRESIPRPVIHPRPRIIAASVISHQSGSDSPLVPRPSP